jgi:hypothetical protein
MGEIQIPGIKHHDCYKDRNFTEISWLVNDMVKHVQIAQGMDPHFTEFRWIPPSEFKQAFKKVGFIVDVRTDKTTDIYICRRR